MDAGNPNLPNSTHGRWTLRCRVCGRESVVDPEDVMHFVTGGWPRCCAEVMTISVEPPLEGGLAGE